MVITEDTNSIPPSLPAAAEYTPKYLYTGFPDPLGRPDVKIRDDFYGTRRKLRIGVLGAGLTGINFLHYAEEELRDVEIVVYERNEDVGGVWFLNKYPGCRCDIPSIVYQFSWRPNIWSEMYAPAAENLEYLRTIAKENGFYEKYIKLRHEIMQASWTDEEAKWTLLVKDLSTGTEFEDKVDVFLEFNGPVSNPRVPPLPGIEEFQGQVVHPTKWTDNTSVDGKRVAVIGYGSSGVQIVPNIVDKVSKLYTWFRNKTFVLPPPNQGFSAAEGANFKYSEEQKALLNDPDTYLAYRKAVDEASIIRYSYVINGNPTAIAVREMVVNYMRLKLSENPKLFSLLVPEDFNVGCRRQTFAFGYLEALCNPKTTVFLVPPQRFTRDGIVDSSGTEHPLDMVITATGFDQSHLPRFPKLVNGISMFSKWKALRSPPSYLAVALAGMPNYFNPSSAYGPLPQGNYYQSSEAFTKYIVKCLDKMQRDRIISLVPSPTAVDQFVRHSNAWLKRTAMSGPCVAWFKGNDNDRPPALWPGARSQFLHVMEHPRFEDYDITYEDPDDRFAFLGNGWSLDVEGLEGADRTWYMGKPQREVGREVLDRLKGTDESVRRDGQEMVSGFVGIA